MDELELHAFNDQQGSLSIERVSLPAGAPTTKAIEALNRQLRKAIKTKGHFPNDDAARNLIYLAGPKRDAPVDEVPATAPRRCWRSSFTSLTRA